MPDAARDPLVEYDRVVGELVAEGVARAGSLFGMPSLNVYKKAFAGFAGGAMVFKLRGPEHTRALALPGACLFDPSHMGRPMKAWVEVPATASDQWMTLARAALTHALEE